MKNKKYFILIVMLLGTLSLPACKNLPTGDDAEGADPTATADLQATIDAAVAMTATAEAANDAAIEQAVQATVGALPSPTPAPTVEAIEMTEQELEEIIDEAVNEAVAASEQVYTTTSEATYDNAISEDELYYLEYYMYAAELALAYADDLIAIYYDLYGAYAYEAVEVLFAMEEEMEMIAQSLYEIDQIIQLGAEAATIAITELNEAVANAEVRHDAFQEMAQGWTQTAQMERDERIQEILSLQPSELAGNFEGTLVLLHEYVDSVKGGFADGKISADELRDIAQRGVNAQVSLEQFGRPSTQGLSSSITDLTGNIAGGQWPQAQKDLPSFELSLPERPTGPGISLPKR